MKICIIGDVHWSKYSSNLRNRDKYFSTRLKGLIDSLNWVEETSKKYGCVEEVFLGDFFDKPDLESEEITALSEINWNNTTRLKHFIVGNHESGSSDLVFNSTQCLHKVGVVEDSPVIYPFDDKTSFLFLPYITEDERKPFTDYIRDREPGKKLIVFSHNDIKNVWMGKFLSPNGFGKNEVDDNCDLFINGHIHNGSWITDKILNLGNLSGQNFSEDAFKFNHHIAILDTDTLDMEFIENPYAFNFYKVEINTLNDLKKLNFKDNAVVSLKCPENLKDECFSEIKNNSKIITSRIILDRTTSSVEVSQDKLETVDHLGKFYSFVLKELEGENVAVLTEELNAICK